MSFDILVFDLLCVVIANVINIACFKDNALFTFVSFKKEGVCLNNIKKLLSSIFV
jgi:hypothetical protein